MIVHCRTDVQLDDACCSCDSDWSSHDAELNTIYSELIILLLFMLFHNISKAINANSEFADNINGPCSL